MPRPPVVRSVSHSVSSVAARLRTAFSRGARASTAFTRLPEMPPTNQGQGRFISGLAGATGQRSMLGPPPLPQADYPGAQQDQAPALPPVDYAAQQYDTQPGAAVGGAGESPLARMAREIATDMERGRAGTEAGPSSAPSTPPYGSQSRRRQHTSGTPILDCARDMLPSISGQALDFAPNALFHFGRNGDTAIGDGGFATAYRAGMSPTGGRTDALGRKLLSPIFVIKNSHNSTDEQVKNEVSCLKKAGEFGFTPANSSKLIVMKDGGANLGSFLSAGSIRCDNDNVYIEPPPLSQRRSIGKQLVGCLAKLHEAGVAHLDVKPENIAINGNGTLSLIDFGGAAQSAGTKDGVHQYRVTSFSRVYAAPEVLQDNYVSSKADIWAAGMVLLEMELGIGNSRLPTLCSKEYEFNLQTHQTLLNEINNDANISAQCKQVLLKCLSLDPTQRPSAKELLTYDYFRPRKASEMSAMELSVAHAKAFKDLADAEKAMERASSDRSLNQVQATAIFEKLLTTRARVKELQVALAKFGSDASTSTGSDNSTRPLLGQRRQPRWSR